MDVNTFVQWVEAIKEHLISGDILLLIVAVGVLVLITYLIISIISAFRALIDALACLLSFGKILPEITEEPSMLSKAWDKIRAVGRQKLLPPQKSDSAKKK